MCSGEATSIHEIRALAPQATFEPILVKKGIKGTAMTLIVDTSVIIKKTCLESRETSSYPHKKNFGKSFKTADKSII